MTSNTSKKRKVENTDSPPHISAFAALAARNRQTQQELNLVTDVKLSSSPSNLSKKAAVQDSKPLENENLVPIPPTILQLSTVRPDQVKRSNKTSLQIILEPGDRLVALGQYDISVTKGCVTVLGATLYASMTKYHVDAPSSHCLPVIRCPNDIEAAEICLSQSSSGLEQLGQISPFFRRIWSDSLSFSGDNDENTATSDQHSLHMGSFRIIFSIVDVASRNIIRPIISPPEWNVLLSSLESIDSQKAPLILICGPKSAGKSTFSKLLTNRIMRRGAARNLPINYNSHGVVALDCDPGQPEYSVPGQLSLHILRHPNFGPPFSHPLTHDNQNQLIRAHSIASVAPSSDPELYMSCIQDLLNHYSAQFSNHPLVINTPGWILGTGLEILVGLIETLRPTAVVYMSQAGPSEVVESLKEAAKSIPLYKLPSQGIESAARNSSNLRAMQTMSYFHLKDDRGDNLSWDPTPLSFLPPIQIRYTVKKSGILGILHLGDQPPPDLLVEAINGSVLAIVVIDDLAAIPDYKSKSPLETSTKDSIIIRTPKEQIPYFNPRRTIALDPQHSHTIGCLLVRGIDVHHRRLQVVTPILPKVFQEVREAGKSIVLVSGKLDNPSWAYTEELYREPWMKRKPEHEEDSDSDEIAAVDAREFENIPWVERLVGGKGRGDGGKVWKVRRDLGKKGG